MGWLLSHPTGAPQQRRSTACRQVPSHAHVADAPHLHRLHPTAMLTIDQSPFTQLASLSMYGLAGILPGLSAASVLGLLATLPSCTRW